MLLERLGYSDLGVFIAEDAESVEIVRLQNIILSEISLKKDAEAAKDMKRLEKYSTYFEPMDELFF